ncbi:MAG: hypothetical protein ACKO34_00630 [Vampirovibrionales bacterium]
MGEINLTFLLILVSFLVFVQLLKRVFFQPMATLFERRQAELEAIRSEADRLTAEYLELETALEAQQASQRLALRQQWEDAQKQIDQTHEAAVTQLKLKNDELLREHKAAVLGRYQQSHQHMQQTLQGLIQKGLQQLLPSLIKQ